MRLWVGITDNEWFYFLRGRPDLDEVNFWQPGGTSAFRALSPGEPFLFKLHSPSNFVAGGGYFCRFSHLPLSIAWETFGPKNGAATLAEMRARIGRYREEARSPFSDPVIGNIVLLQPFFLRRKLDSHSHRFPPRNPERKGLIEWTARQAENCGRKPARELPPNGGLSALRRRLL